MTVAINPATDADLPAAVSLLRACDLPSDGLVDHLSTVLVGRAGASIVASAALEVYGATALLRSVAVASAHRGKGLGERITRAVLDLARERGVRVVYLLTTTAGTFFEQRLGFSTTTRTAVPETVRASAAFTRLCPETARVMVRELPASMVVLFACVQNAGRSQMAAAFFNALSDTTRAHAISAGTRPADHVHPMVVDAMREVGIDLVSAVPTHLTDALAASARVLVTMGCGDACPFVPGMRRIDWSLPDPNGQSIERVQAIRDDIRLRVLDLLRSEGWARRPR